MSEVLNQNNNENIEDIENQNLEKKRFKTDTLKTHSYSNSFVNENHFIN